MTASGRTWSARDLLAVLAAVALVPAALAAPSAPAPPAPPQSASGACGAAWSQCGGRSWAGASCCQDNMQCGRVSSAFSHCLPQYNPGYNSSAPAPPALPAPPSTTVAAPSSGQRCCRSRVAIFDFDNTVKLSSGNTAHDARWVMEQCRAAGFQFAVATASCDVGYVKRYLHNVDSWVWTDALLSSGAFQGCQPTKTYSLNNIKSYYSLWGGAGRCAVLLDDSAQNKAYADATGVGFVKVDPSTGLQRGDFGSAQGQLDAVC